MGNRKNKAVVETVAQIVFTICAFFAVLAVVSITLYMIMKGTRGYARTAMLARAPGARTLFETIPAVMTANTARKNRASQIIPSALNQIAAAVTAL